jgi:hypothetical protein
MTNVSKTITDSYQRTITVQSNVSGQDIYSFTGQSLSFPTGTSQAIVLSAINTMAPANWTPPSIPLNQQYSSAAYGQALIAQLGAYNTARGLTDAQTLEFAQNFDAYGAMLQAGSLQSVLDEIPSIPVDGTLVTSALVGIVQSALQNYLNGN